ncbi:MAG: methionyl-tRNA formyltransferase [Clostridia bacterium]|nr:methionyl-tRNA formyltransferase [Clostridia bacterium]
MKILFMGTPDFAVESLKALANAGHEITGVVTIPDKPRGRGHKLAHTPVYEAALSMGYTIYTPSTLKQDEFESVLTATSPDAIVVVAYGKILPEYVLNYPKFGCINVHASLLPKYRGAAPMQRCIIDGEKTTGVTTMYMAKGLDTGDMLLKKEVEIKSDDNFETIHDKLASCGAELIVETMRRLENGTCKAEKQDDSLACYAHMITKETCLINWQEDASRIHNLVRGLYPVPKAYTCYEGKQMKILVTNVAPHTTTALPGTIVRVDKDSFCVACGSGSVLEIMSIQPEGKRMMAVSEYLKGNSLALSTILGG